MKIQSNSRVHVGQLIKFSNGIKIQFDRNGIADVPDDQGKFLLEKYTELLFPPGKPPKVEKEQIPKTSANAGEVEVLKEKLVSANHLISQYKQETGQAKEGEGVWRGKCDELIEQVKELESKVIPTETEDEKEKRLELEAAEIEEKLEERIEERIGEKLDERVLSFIVWFMVWQADKDLEEFETSQIYDAFIESLEEEKPSKEEVKMVLGDVVKAMDEGLLSKAKDILSTVSADLIPEEISSRLVKLLEAEKPDEETDDEKKAAEEKNLKTALGKKTVAQLQEIAKELKLPEKSWKDLLKDPLINYIVDETLKKPNA